MLGNSAFYVGKGLAVGEIWDACALHIIVLVLVCLEVSLHRFLTGTPAGTRDRPSDNSKELTATGDFRFH